MLLLAACSPSPSPTATPTNPTPTPSPTAAPTLTPTPTQVPTPGASIGQSALVAFIKDGDILIWDEATGQSRTIFDSGDVIRVELSDDGELAAFLRRSYFEADGFDRHEQSALWVVELDGENPRELVSAQELRDLLTAAETDSTNIPEMAWIPGTHNLLYSGWKYFVVAEGESHATPEGMYSVDADTLERTVLAPAGNSLGFVPSPNGGKIALISTTDVRVMNADGSIQSQAILNYPATGVPMRLIPEGVWTQDASALLVAAPTESGPVPESNIVIWRVPVDGSPAHPLATIKVASYDSITFSNDGRYVAFSRGDSSGQGWFTTPLTPEAGLLSVPKSAYLFAKNLHWSPAGVPYAIHDGALDQLCPEAVQDVEVCSQGLILGNQIAEISWIDDSRFVFVTREPYELYFGGLDGRRLLLGEGVERFATALIPCQNESEITAGGSTPAGMSVAPDTLFAQTWRLRNTGTCAWDASYRLAYISGERLSGPHSLHLGETVPPGGEIELSVNLIAPADPGRYQGEWQLLDPDGAPFGARAPVDIAVPSFTVTEFAPDQIVAKIPAESGQLAFGEGALWLLSGDAVSRIDLDTNQVVATIPVGEFRVDLTTGYGAVWATANGIVHRIDPQTNQVSASIQPAASLNLNGIAAGAGSVWVSSADEETIFRIDPGTNQVITAIHIGLSSQQIAVTEDAVWVANLKFTHNDEGTWVPSAGAPNLVRIDPITNEVSAAIPLDCHTRNLAVDVSAVWVPCDVAPVVYRIDPQTNQVLARIALPDRPRHIASDSNAVWVTSTTGNTLTRIDPATNQVTAIYSFGEGLVDVIAAQGELFVTTGSAIWRIRP
jgi:DNA-binding beta-propeller fold protein YncE